MNDKNRTDKIKKGVIKISLFIVTTFVILFLYGNLSKIEYDVSKEDVFLAISEDDETVTDSEEYSNDTIGNDFEDKDRGPDSNEDFDDDSLKDNLKKVDNDNEGEEIEDTGIDTSTAPITAPDLRGMDEATAISTCTQNGYKYSMMLG